MVQQQMWEGPRDGATYDDGFDRDRLNKQARAIYDCMANGTWWTLSGLRHFTGHPEASISARIRDLRKQRFGGFRVERRRQREGGGIWEYRLAELPIPDISKDA
jgi:hypothetical protein